MNNLKIFLDDERMPNQVYKKTNNDDWVIVRTVPEFKDLINSHEPEEIGFLSFDNDLGTELEGKDAIKWLVHEKQYDIRDIECNVHSANTATWHFSEGLLNNWKKHLIDNA